MDYIVPMNIPKLSLTILILSLSAFSVIWFSYSYNGFSVVAEQPGIDYARIKQVRFVMEEENPTIKTTIVIPQQPKLPNQMHANEVASDSDSEVPNQEVVRLLPTFRLHYVEEVENNAQKICSECTDLNCNSRCAVFNDFVQKLATLQQGKDVRSPRLNLIPLDPIIWKMELSGATSSEFNDSVERVARSFDALPSYLRFKGSDHIFLCLTEEGCSEFARIFSEKLSNNRGTRAILAGVNLDRDSIKWPCPLRIMDITIEEKKSSDSLVKKVLKEGDKLIYKGSRWICADETHPVNHWDKIEEGRFVAANYIQEFNFGLCVFPKGGSTSFKMFMKRLMHRKDWNTKKHIHGPYRNGLISVNTVKKPLEAKELFEDPGFIKGAIVRNPASRVISAYLDKIINSHRYGAVPGLRDIVKRQQHQPPTFAQFVNLLTKEGREPNVGDKHFRSQTSFCGLNTTKFDFLGDLDHLHEDFIEFAESVGVWEEYGASGWGENGTKPMIDAWNYKQAPHRSTERLWKFYNENLMRKVYRYYKADFDMLGYSIDDLLATRPNNMSKILEV